MDRTGGVRALGPCSVTEQIDILSPAATWLKLGDLLLSEGSWTQTDRFCVSSVIRGMQSSCAQKLEVEWWAPGAGGWLFNGATGSHL